MQALLMTGEHGQKRATVQASFLPSVLEVFVQVRCTIGSRECQLFESSLLRRKPANTC